MNENPESVLEMESLLNKRFRFAANSLFLAYQRIHPGKTRDDYDALAKDVMASYLTGDELMDKLFTDKSRSSPDIGFVLAGTAYLAQAADAMRIEDTPLVADRLMMAIFCCGVVAATGSLKHAEETIRTDERSSISRRGNAAKDAQYDESREKAFEIEGRLRPANGWPSVRQAAIRVEKELKEFVPQNGIAFSQERMVITLQELFKNAVPIRAAR